MINLILHFFLEVGISRLSVKLRYRKWLINRSIYVATGMTFDYRIFTLIRRICRSNIESLVRQMVSGSMITKQVYSAECARDR